MLEKTASLLGDLTSDINQNRNSWAADTGASAEDREGGPSGAGDLHFQGVPMFCVVSADVAFGSAPWYMSSIELGLCTGTPGHANRT